MLTIIASLSCAPEARIRMSEAREGVQVCWLLAPIPQDPNMIALCYALA